MNNKILFILKERQVYSDDTYHTMNSGLYNSAGFVVQMLKDEGVDVTLEEVVDANSIDKLVHQHRPGTVILEAIWVPPAKFTELQRLHPNVKWIIRLHSDIVFMSGEGMAIQWLIEYEKYDNIFIAANSKYAIEALSTILEREVLYFPNYYPVRHKTLEIGCFGSIRPLKNQLIQALAAVKYADTHHLHLNFHINSSRTEMRGENVLKNLRALFANSRHNLIEHPWMNHEEFIKLVRTMDCGMQVSLSETYNIVAADFVANDIPIVTSEEIAFVHPSVQVDTKDLSRIVEGLDIAIENRHIICPINKELLKRNAHRAQVNINKLLFSDIEDDVKKKEEGS